MSPDPHDATFITRLEHDPEAPLRLVVKDCIDVAGAPTTVGCAVIADSAQPAADDAACLAGARAAGVAIVGKANLHELCFGPSGVNPHFGTPRNPLDPARIPGGSSSGSAVAVVADDADIALGTDTAGSVRNPAACCGAVGLKTTHGRVSLDGVYPLAPSMDTVGPIARDVAGVVAGMALLEAGFEARSSPWGPDGRRVGRIRPDGVDPAIDAAVDAALAVAGIEVDEVIASGWVAAHEAGRVVMFAEALRSNARLYPAHREQLGADVVARFEAAASFDEQTVKNAYTTQAEWKSELSRLLGRVGVLVLAGYPTFPPLVSAPDPASSIAAVAVSLAGVPSIVIPVPVPESHRASAPLTADGVPFPASLQIVGAHGSEETIVAVAAEIESALAAARR